MNHDDDLDPSLVDALRNVGGSESGRDERIEVALDEMPRRRSAPLGVRIVASVAVLSIVLTAAGVFLAGTDPDGIAVDTTSSVPPKGGADCAEEFSGLWGDSRGLADIVHASVPYAVIQRNGAVSVYLGTEPCDKQGEIDYWQAMQARDDNGATGAPGACAGSLEIVAAFNDRANGEPHRFVLVKSGGTLDLRFEDRCNAPLGSITLP